MYTPLTLFLYFTLSFTRSLSLSIAQAGTLFALTVYYWIFTNKSEILENYCVDLMLGYLVYDSTHETFFTQQIGKTTIIHHILGSISLASARYYACREAIKFHMIIFLAEAR